MTNSNPVTADRQLQTYNWRGIFEDNRPFGRAAKKIVENFFSPGKITPFGETFYGLATAVVCKGKPVAEFSYVIYLQEKITCDIIIRCYGLEKLIEADRDLIWIFRPEIKDDAYRRISQINNIRCKKPWNMGHDIIEGRLLGYSEEDINKWILYVTIGCMLSFARTKWILIK